MTKTQLIDYLRVCADLADKPGDGVAHVGVEDLRHVIALLSDEPSATQICHWSGCNQPIAHGDSYLCSGHRSAIERGVL